MNRYDEGRSRDNNIINVNPRDREPGKNNYLLSFYSGPFAKGIHLRVWAADMDEAFSIAVDDWLVEHAPGLLYDDEVYEAFKEARVRGLSPEKARTEAHADYMSVGDGHFVDPSLCSAIENPSRADILRVQGRT